MVTWQPNIGRPMLLLDQPDVIYGVCNTKLDYFLIPISYNKYEVILLLELWGP
jgi:hypothetical protein